MHTIIEFAEGEYVLKLKIGDTVYPKTMITYSNKQHMFEDDSGIVVGFESQKRDEDNWWGTETERVLVVVRSMRGQLFEAGEDFWIKE